MKRTIKWLFRALILIGALNALMITLSLLVALLGAFSSLEQGGSSLEELVREYILLLKDYPLAGWQAVITVGLLVIWAAVKALPEKRATKK